MILSTNTMLFLFTFRGSGVGAPFNCAQCGTDFTPVWKWEKPPSRKGQSSNATFHNLTGEFIILCIFSYTFYLVFVISFCFY